MFNVGGDIFPIVKISFKPRIRKRNDFRICFQSIITICFIFRELPFKQEQENQITNDCKVG